MRKLVLSVVAVSVLASVAACGGPAPTAEAQASSSAAATTSPSPSVQTNTAEVCGQLSAAITELSKTQLAQASVDYSFAAKDGNAARTKAAAVKITAILAKFADQVTTIAAGATDPAAKTKFDEVAAKVRESSGEKLGGSQTGQTSGQIYSAELKRWVSHLQYVCDMGQFWR